MKRTLKTLAVTAAIGALGLGGVLYFGLINVGADDPHWAPVHGLLAAVRERSIELRARDIQVPNLEDPALIRSGAGNYHSMCIGCHLAPGVAPTELSQNLYPAPANLSTGGVERSPAATFWVIKHGIKATGMPAWGKSMGDPYLWGLVAFVQQLPTLDAQGYQALVAASEGHQHGGGETRMHDHAGQHDSHADPQAEHPAPAAMHHPAEPAPAAAPKVHIHDDGKQHLHEH